MKKRNILFVVLAVVFLIIIVFSGMEIYKLIFRLGDKSSVEQAEGHQTVGKIKKWEDKSIYERYPWIYIDEISYSFVGTCNGEARVLLGQYTAIGVEDTQFGIVNHEIMVCVYEIAGISEDFAIAVQFDGTDGYYAYCNERFLTDNYSQFSDACQLEEYLEMNCIFLYEGIRAKYICEGDIPTQMIMGTLFSEEDVPMFLREEFPTEFFYKNAVHADLTETGTAPYNPNPKETSDEIAEFCKDKEYGNQLVSISSRYNLFEDKGFRIDVYSGGFVSTNIGVSSKIFFVGKKAVENFMEAITEKLIFVEKKK